MGLILKTKPFNPTGKGTTMYFVTALITKGDVERFKGFDASMVGADVKMSILVWAKIIGIKPGTIRCRFNKAQKDKRNGEPFNSARQIVGLDPINIKTASKFRGVRKKTKTPENLAWLYRKAG